MLRAKRFYNFLRGQTTNTKIAVVSHHGFLRAFSQVLRTKVNSNADSYSNDEFTNGETRVMFVWDIRFIFIFIYIKSCCRCVIKCKINLSHFLWFIDYLFRTKSCNWNELLFFFFFFWKKIPCKLLFTSTQDKAFTKSMWLNKFFQLFKQNEEIKIIEESDKVAKEEIVANSDSTIVCNTSLLICYL